VKLRKTNKLKRRERFCLEADDKHTRETEPWPERDIKREAFGHVDTTAAAVDGFTFNTRAEEK
jgi:hypothetical protein